MKGAAYYRARNSLIGKYISRETDDKKKRWLQYGFVPEEYNDQFDKECEQTKKLYNDSPLSFTELTTYSTWYAIHPEKVAGIMDVGTSLFFPVVVKGTRKDVEKFFSETLKQVKADDTDMEMLELEAEALELELNLLNVK